jgi:hypothetical protein
MTDLYNRDPKAYLRILLPPERLGIHHDVTEVRDTGNFLGPPPPPVAPPPTVAAQNFLDGWPDDDEIESSSRSSEEPVRNVTPPRPQTNFLSSSESESSSSDDPVQNPPQNFLDSDDEDEVEDVIPTARPAVSSRVQPLQLTRAPAPTGQAPNPPRPAAQRGRVEKDLHGDYYMLVNNKWEKVGKTIPSHWVVSEPRPRAAPQQWTKKVRPANQPGRCEYWNGQYWVRDEEAQSWRLVGRTLPAGWKVDRHGTRNPPDDRQIRRT